MNGDYTQRFSCSLSFHQITTREINFHSTYPLSLKDPHSNLLWGTKRKVVLLHKHRKKKNFQKLKAKWQWRDRSSRKITKLLKNVLRKFTLELQRVRLKFEKQPSHTIVRGAQVLISSPVLVLYCTPLIVPFSSRRDVTVPCTKVTLKKMWISDTKKKYPNFFFWLRVETSRT